MEMEDGQIISQGYSFPRLFKRKELKFNMFEEECVRFHAANRTICHGC